MSFNYVLIWLVIGSSVMTIIRIARAAHTYQRGWIVVSALVIIVTAVMIFLRPDIAGYAGGGLWFALALLPSLLGRFAIRATLQQNYAIARNLGMIVRFLHPADGWERQPQLMGALGLAQDGKIAESSEILSRLRTAQNVVGRTAALQFFRMSGQWEECLAWIQQTPIAARREFGFVMNHLRALGETGDLNGMLAEFERAEKQIDAGGMAGQICRLIALAFCGSEQLAALLRGPLGLLPGETKLFWTATADFAAGREFAARGTLAALRESSDHALRIAADRRLSHPVSGPQETLTSESLRILSRIERAVTDEALYPRPSFAPSRAYATYALITLNISVFVSEVVSGGSESGITLYRLGAMHPASVLRGEWWRLLSALFLHFGVVHLLMNMIGLHLLGPFVERALGIRALLFTYFASGIGSMAIVVFLASRGDPQDWHILVGASGCIMGLVGATGAVLLRGWRKEKSQLARKRLAFVVFVIVFQAVFDMLTPQVSFTAHLSGSLVGFAVASMMRHRLFGVQPIPAPAIK